MQFSSDEEDIKKEFKKLSAEEIMLKNEKIIEKKSKNIIQLMRPWEREIMKDESLMKRLLKDAVASPFILVYVHLNYI